MHACHTHLNFNFTMLQGVYNVRTMIFPQDEFVQYVRENLQVGKHVRNLLGCIADRSPEIIQVDQPFPELHRERYDGDACRVSDTAEKAKSDSIPLAALERPSMSY